MPFIHVKVAGAALGQAEVATLQEGVTALVADTMGEVGGLERVLGPDLSEVSDVVVGEVPMDGRGHGGLRQARRAERPQAGAAR